MRKYLLVTIVIIAVAFVAAYMMLPKNSEVALMNLKDKRFTAAMENLEKEREAGNTSVSVSMPLVKLYLQHGDIESAIKLVEEYVEAHPDSVSAREQLGMLYQYAQRPDDYKENLEIMEANMPSPAVLEELSDIYNFNGEYEKQITVLKQLVEMAPETPKHYVSLAVMQATFSQMEDAKNTMLKLADRHPDYADGNTLELMLSIALDAGDPGEAVAKTREWIEVNRDIGVASRLADLLRVRGRPDLGMALLLPFEDKITTEPMLLSSYANLLYANREEKKAYDLLLDLHNNKQLPPSLYELLLEYSTEARDYKTAHKILREIDLTTLPEATIANVVETAIESRNGEVVQYVSDQLDGEYRKNHPYVDTALAIAQKKSNASGKLAALRESGALNDGQILQLARLLRQSGQSGRALELVESLAPYKKLSDTDLSVLADLYIELDKADKGYELFDALHNERPSSLVEISWIKLSAAAGHSQRVIAWLNANDDAKISDRLLTDLYFVGITNRAYELALESASRLFARHDNDVSRHYLANAQLYNNQVEKAMETIRPVKDVSADTRTTYMAALSKLAKKDPAYAKEFVELLTAQINDPQISDKEKQDVIYMLMEHGGSKTVLPYLRQYASEFGGSWIGLYESSLESNGQTKELLEFRLKRADMNSISDSEKRSIAYYLLENGHKIKATQLFYDLANRPNASDNDISQLLYLWGPRPDTKSVDWIEKQARISNGEQRLTWLNHLNYIGYTDRTLAVIYDKSLVGQALKSPKFFDIYAFALQKQNRHKDIKQAIMARANDEEDVARLRSLAGIASQEQDLQAVNYVYQKILKKVPNDKEALRNLGAVAFAEGAYTLSTGYFNRYFELGYSDFESMFYYGELMWRQKNVEAANQYYDKSLEKIHAANTKTTAMRAVTAQILYRKGKKDESFAIFRDIMNNAPGDLGLKADFIAVLIESFIYREAASLLAK